MLCKTRYMLFTSSVMCDYCYPGGLNVRFSWSAIWGSREGGGGLYLLGFSNISKVMSAESLPSKPRWNELNKCFRRLQSVSLLGSFELRSSVVSVLPSVTIGTSLSKGFLCYPYFWTEECIPDLFGSLHGFPRYCSTSECEPNLHTASVWLIQSINALLCSKIRVLHAFLSFCSVFFRNFP